MVTIILGVLVFAVACIAGVLFFRRTRMTAMHERVAGMSRDYADLLAKYERVQDEYDQGVLEGIRQGYVNVRVFLTANMEESPPPERAFLVTWLHPRLARLGEMESKLLADMKGDDVVSMSDKLAETGVKPLGDVHILPKPDFVEPERTVGYAQAARGPDGRCIEHIPVHVDIVGQPCRGNGDCAC